MAEISSNLQLYLWGSLVARSNAKFSLLLPQTSTSTNLRFSLIRQPTLICILLDGSTTLLVSYITVEKLEVLIISSPRQIAPNAPLLQDVL